MTFFAPSGPRTPPEPAPNTVTWPGKCPACGSDTTWRAVAVNSGDYSRTKVDYTFECDCLAVEEIA